MPTCNESDRSCLSESELTCLRCDGVMLFVTLSTTQRVPDPLGRCLLQMGVT